jgi:hypothetical protein
MEYSTYSTVQYLLGSNIPDVRLSLYIHCTDRVRTVPHSSAALAQRLHP